MAAIGDVVIDIERCKGCGVCTTGCPKQVLSMSDEVNAKGYHYAIKVNADCIGCANCAVICPDGCITVYRARK